MGLLHCTKFKFVCIKRIYVYDDFSFLFSLWIFQKFFIDKINKSAKCKSQNHIYQVNLEQIPLIGCIKSLTNETNADIYKPSLAYGHKSGAPCEHWKQMKRVIGKWFTSPF